MSATTILSTLYDFDYLFTQEKRPNMNRIRLSTPDKKAVGTPLSSSSSTNSCSSPPSFLRSHSTSNANSTINANKCSVFPFRDEPVLTSGAIMNKENALFFRSYSESGDRLLQEVMQQKINSQVNSTRYKTELCRPFEENGTCKYGEKCQFAHGYRELRNLSRHPKYKTEPCRTFHTIGYCPYGSRCHFIHNADEQRLGSGTAAFQDEPKPTREHRALNYKQFAEHVQRNRPGLFHSVSFAGFPGRSGFDQPQKESPSSRTPPPPSMLYEDMLSPTFLPEQDLEALLAPLFRSAQCDYTDQAGATFCGASVCETHLSPSSPPYPADHAQNPPRLSQSPGFDRAPSPPDSMSDRESYMSGSPSSSSFGGSESPTSDAGKRLAVFSRLSTSDD